MLNYFRPCKYPSPHIHDGHWHFYSTILKSVEKARLCVRTPNISAVLHNRSSLLPTIIEHPHTSHRNWLLLLLLRCPADPYPGCAICQKGRRRTSPKV